eukprot:1052735-Prymnesium_polylepis.1
MQAVGRWKHKGETGEPTAALLAGSSNVRSDAVIEHVETASTFQDEEEYDRQKMQIIKARTMYEMVEEIHMPTGLCKLLFLTGPQADLLASSNDSLQKMLDALEVPAPKLVINLLASQGFDEYVSSHGTGLQKDAAKGEAGMVYGRSAFLTMDEERIAEERIDQFMSTVLIPLAAQTNAVVI